MNNVINVQVKFQHPFGEHSGYHQAGSFGEGILKSKRPSLSVTVNSNSAIFKIKGAQQSLSCTKLTNKTDRHFFVKSTG